MAKKELEMTTSLLEALWDAAIPLSDASLQSSVRFNGKEEPSLHKFVGAEFRWASNEGILVKYKNQFGIIPSTNVKFAYFKNAV